MTLLWTILHRAWPLVLGGLLLFGAWQMIQSHREVSEAKGRADQTIEYLKDELQAESEVADVIAEQAEQARAAERTRARERNKLRAENERLRSELGEIVGKAAVDDCARQPVHPDIGRLLKRSDSQDGGAGLSGTAEPGGQ